MSVQFYSALHQLWNVVSGCVSRQLFRLFNAANMFLKRNWIASNGFLFSLMSPRQAQSAVSMRASCWYTHEFIAAFSKNYFYMNSARRSFSTCVYSYLLGVVLHFLNFLIHFLNLVIDAHSLSTSEIHSKFLFPLNLHSAQKSLQNLQD